MIVGIISVCGIISELWLRCTCGVVGGNKDPTLELSRIELHRMTRSVCVTAPVFCKVVFRISLKSLRAVNLGSNVHGSIPVQPAVVRSDIPHLAQAIPFSYFTFVVI